MRGFSSKNSILFFSSALSVLAFAVAANAQQATESGTLDDVIVTATRSETNLQKTPIAVTALSAAALEQRGVSNISDLGALSPNVSVGSRSGAGSASGAIAIRGIGLDANAPASPAVGIYVDDVYAPAAFGNLIGVFDVDRIEVLRGPQGTLFGRNTIGGAIQYVTKKPKLGEFSGFVEGTVGNLDRADLSGAVNIPIGDRAAFRVSLAQFGREGYVHDQLNNVDRGSQDTTEGRVQFHMDATDKLTIDAKFEALDQKSNGRATVPVGFGYATFFGGAFAPNGLDPFISSSNYAIAGLDGPEDFYSDLRLGQLVLGYDLTDNMRIKSITAYQHVEGKIRVDQDGTPVPIISVDRGLQTDELFTQELQLVGDSLSGKLNWTLGAYYYDGSLTSKGTVAQLGPVGIGALSDPFGDYEVNTKSVAIYGQATYNLTDKLAVVAGLRYTSEDQDVDGGGVFGAPYAYAQSLSFEDTAPLIGLNYQASDDVMLYAKASKGFRAGGFAPAAPFAAEFKQETAWTYETGARMQFLDGRLRVNPTYFHTEWKAVQFNSVTFIPGSPFPIPIIDNGPDVEADGLELESQFALTDKLSVNLTASWLDAAYSSIPATVPPGKFTLNSELGRAPETQFSVGGLYKLPLGELGDLTTSLGYTWQAEQRSASADTDFVILPSYGLLNGRIEYAAPGGKWSIALFGTNLTDEDYINGGTNYPGGGTIPTIANDVGRPQEYGVTLRANF